MKIYSLTPSCLYSGHSKEYLGRVCPAGYTDIEPPKPESGCMVRFIEKEQRWEQVPRPELKLDTSRIDPGRYRDSRLEQLASDFSTACASARIDSEAAGFPIDADEVANRNVDGLVTVMEANGTETASFCDADNVMHDVSLEQLRAMRLEIIAHAQRLYARKWAIRTALLAAETVEDLLSISWGDNLETSLLKE